MLPFSSRFVILILYILNAQFGDGIAEHVGRFSLQMDPFIFDSAKPSTIIWSPVSVFASLVPFLNAATEPTLSDLQHLLGINDTQNFELGINFNQSSLAMFSGLFVQKELKLKKSFSKEFKSVQNFDNSVNLTEKINQWVKNATDGLIPNVLNSVNEDAKLILVNGVSFKGTWKEKFKKDKTMVKIFHGAKSNILVEMMFQKSVQNYGQFVTQAGESFEIMKMGYRESQMHIIFVLPQKTELLSNVFKYLTQFEVRKLSELLERLEPTELEILIPKMKVSTRVGIQAALEQAGLSSLFSSMTSNLSNMLKESNSSMALHVDQFVHETVFELDEDGTKAGAASASVFVPLIGISPQIFTLDRPFIVFLRWEGKFTFFEGIVTDLDVIDAPENETSSEQNKSTPAPEAETIKNAKSINITKSTKGNWWVQNGPPAYLEKEFPNTEQNTTTPVLNRLVSTNKTNTSEIFQQPEPKDPSGIRFPNPKGNFTILKLKYLGMGKFQGNKVNKEFVSLE